MNYQTSDIEFSFFDQQYTPSISTHKKNNARCVRVIVVERHPPTVSPPADLNG